jgi:hypothetical protein
MQDGLFAIYYKGMASVMAALKAHYGAGAVSQQIDDLALTLIAPLGADHDDILAHSVSCFRDISSGWCNG